MRRGIKSLEPDSKKSSVVKVRRWRKKTKRASSVDKSQRVLSTKGEKVQATDSFIEK